MMSKDELSNEVTEYMLIFKDRDFQKIWSVRFVSASAEDYAKMMGLVNNKSYLTQSNIYPQLLKNKSTLDKIYQIF